MPGVAGVDVKHAIRKGSTWGTPVACGAGHGVLCLPTGIKEGDAAIDVDDSQGLFWSQDGTPGPIKVEGDIPMYLRYDGCELFLALVMGVAGVPIIPSGGTISRAYTYQAADDVDGLFATFVRHWKNYVEEIRSLKLTGFTIKGERGKPLQLIVNAIGDASVEDGTNTTTTFNNVTIREISNRVQMSQGVFRLNNQGAGALSSGDIIYPSSFELTISRKLKGEYTGQYALNGRDVIDEPTNEGMPEVSLKLQFPRHTSKTRLSELGSDTRKKMDITFTGGIIEGAIARSFKIELPHLQPKSVDIADAAGNIVEPVEFVCHGIPTAPSGMAGLTKPVRISGVNKLTTNPLA